jgi:biopolymer transport protein TolQ
MSLLLGGSPVVLLVLWLLIILSVWSWSIIFSKWLQFRRARADNETFDEIFQESRNLSRIDDSSRRLLASPLARLFASGYRELVRLIQDPDASVKRSESDLDIIQSALKRAEIEEMIRLEKGIVFLATVSSAAPFIGLFGTVWGIMNAFRGLSVAKSSTIQAVAPGISEALIATAVGLAAAIPAAMAYNYYSSRLKDFRLGMGSFSRDFLVVARKTYGTARAV